MISPPLETIAGGLSTAAAGFLGSKILPLLGEIAPSEVPTWMQYLLGPLGALAGMIVAIWWLSTRLDKAELKADKRETERDEDRKTLILALEKNSNVIRDINDVIGRCKGGHQ